MLTKAQIKTIHAVLVVANHKGATFSCSCDPVLIGRSVEHVSEDLLDMNAQNFSITFEFREEDVCFSVTIDTDEIADDPMGTLERVMQVRRAFVNFSSN